MNTTWILLGIGALILAGFIIKHFVKRKPAELRRCFRKPKQRARECQLCQNFISCIAAKVTECPLLKS